MTPLSTDAITRLLAFLPYFSEDREFYVIDADRSFFDPFVYSPRVEEFVHLLYEFDVIPVGDWTAWQTQAVRYVADPGMVAKARLTTLRKLLTLHVRKERFCSGHLAAMIDAGHIRAILERLETLSRASEGSPNRGQPSPEM